jgi:hypothetical protein
MTTLRCTKKALALLNVGGRALADPPSNADDWYMNLLWLDRRKCILLTHAETLFPVFVADVRAADLRPLGHFIVEKIEAALASEGLPADCLGVLDPDAVQVAKTASRSVLGFMNEMALFLEYVVAEEGGAERPAGPLRPPRRGRPPARCARRRAHMPRSRRRARRRRRRPGQGALGRPGEAPGLDRRQQLERPPPLAALHGPPRALDGFPAGVLVHREANVTPSVT